ncbi:hypothetical protein SCOR_21825 [Sulfidibacter corallicola]|uniref:Uncharacterized protein n=1 Tax=Sulfidibacter corallicola TaxID=2818388 RepID=A0A8A4TUX2_SULCO|nr:hypothetical protein [Sulfidibacter corallicola]QTD52934.1 hypothetical protein J3U87_10720 [Sulfidibacter corallicola]
MLLQVDLYQEVVLLLGASLEVVDAFQARGKTRHQTLPSVRFYTYRSLLTLPGHCAVCGKSLDAIGEPCSSSGGFHAFVGLDGDETVPEQHKARARSLSLAMLQFEDLSFYVESDNVFKIDEIVVPMVV